MKRFLVLFFLVLTVVPSQAEEKVRIDEVVVTAGRLEEPIEETTSSVVVITGKDIKEMNVEFVTDVLRKVSGLNLVQNGGAGKLATVLLRGGSSSHTLVMIDGIKVKSTTTGDFDFSGLSVDDIERIEIVKGPQSTIYGGEAMAGVINIITKKGQGKLKTELSFEGGSFGTYKPSATISGGSNRVDYRFTTSYLRTDGISVIRKGTERDGYENASLSGKFGFKIKDYAELEVLGKHYYDLSELDAFSADDPNYIQRGYHSLLSGKGKLYLGKWEQVLTLSFVRDALEYRDPDTSGNNSDIITGMDTIDWQNNLYLSSLYTLTAGAELREEKGENIGVFNKTVNNKALYLNNKLKTLKDTLVLNAGLRHDDHETFGDKNTYRLGAVYDIKPVSLKVRASYGTGFRAPTINELYYVDSWGSMGNPNLKPEKSTSWEAGIDKGFLDDRASVSLTYFKQDYKDLIQWVGTDTDGDGWDDKWQPQNTAKADVMGIETGAGFKITDSIDINASYTYLDAEDSATGKVLPRRAEDKFNLTATVSDKKYSVSTDYTYIGKRYDDTANAKLLTSYSIVNLRGSYNLRKTVSLFARLENILDKDYEEAKGYSVPGRAFYGGIRAAF